MKIKNITKKLTLIKTNFLRYLLLIVRIVSKIFLNFLIQMFYTLIPIVIKCLKLLHNILLSSYFKKIMELFVLLYIITQIIIITATIASIAMLFFPQPEVVELLKMLSYITDDALRVLKETFITIQEVYTKVTTRIGNALRVVKETFIIIQEVYTRILTAFTDALHIMAEVYAKILATVTDALHIMIEVYSKILATVTDALHIITEVYMEITTATCDTLHIIEKSFQNLKTTFIKLTTSLETLERYEIENEKNLLEIDSLKRALEIKERENTVLRAALWNRGFF